MERHEQSLFDMLTNGKLNPLRALGYGQQLCNAVDFLHIHSVAHRDIKPANVFVTGNRLVLGGFGGAKHMVGKVHTVR
jgi:serine/threonine protein kinase